MPSQSQVGFSTQLDHENGTSGSQLKRAQEGKGCRVRLAGKALTSGALVIFVATSGEIGRAAYARECSRVRLCSVQPRLCALLWRSRGARPVHFRKTSAHSKVALAASAPLYHCVALLAGFMSTINETTRQLLAC